MGAILHDPQVPQVQDLLNTRFAPGDAIKEMIAVQKEFKIFDLHHSLRSLSMLLNVAPPEGTARHDWFKYCEFLRNVPAQNSDLKAHDRIIVALKEDLESQDPLPVWFTWHPGTSLTVTHNHQPLIFSKIQYMTISVPVNHA